MPRSLRAAPGRSSAGGASIPRPVLWPLAPAGPAWQPSPAMGLGRRAAWGAKGTLSPETPGALCSLSGTIARVSAPAPRVVSWRLQRAWPSPGSCPGHLRDRGSAGRVAPTSELPSEPPESPPLASSHGGGATIGQASGPRLGVTEVTSEAWAPLTSRPPAGPPAAQEEGGSGLPLRVD